MITFKIFDDSIELSDPYSGMMTHTWFDFSFYSVTGEQLGSFLETLSRHIGAVRQAGEALRIDKSQLNEHDRSKFWHDEMPYYARHFNGDKGNPDGFARAWLHHLHHNEHHHQHWVFSDGFVPKGSTVEKGVIEMPERFVLEMVADWQGAGIVYSGKDNIGDWLFENIPRIRLHSKTTIYLRKVLTDLGYSSVLASRMFANEVDALNISLEAAQGISGQ